MVSRVSVSFWRFAQSIYGADGVAEACLALQDREGADITLLLFAFFCGASGRGTLDAAQLEQAILAVQPWRDGVVAPLRAIRRTLRQSPGGISDETLRNRIKRMELAAERRQMDTLSRLLPSAGQGVSLECRVKDASDTVSAYLALLPGQRNAVRQTVAHQRLVELLTNAFLLISQPNQ